MYTPLSTSGVKLPTRTKTPKRHTAAKMMFAPTPPAITFRADLGFVFFICSSSTSTKAPIGINKKNSKPLDLTFNPTFRAMTPCAPS